LRRHEGARASRWSCASLENEKIDIVPWSPDSATFIRNALNPAKIVGIELEQERKSAHVTVAQGNLAIAIGRKARTPSWRRA